VSSLFVYFWIAVPIIIFSGMLYGDYLDDATLLDMIKCVRDDERKHSQMNHRIAGF